MLINEVVKRTGQSKDTIRYYEKIGLIKVVRSNSEWNNYKDYSEENLNTLMAIKKAKSFGFTLNEIRDILIFVNTDKATCTNLMEQMNDKLKEIDQKINEMNSMKKMILSRVQEVRSLCDSEYQDTTCKIISTEFKM